MAETESIFELSPELRSASEETIADYGAVALAYAKGNMDHDVSQNMEALLSPLAARGSALDILDLCCAGGRDLVTFTAKGHRAIGLDGTAEFCALARTASECEVWHQDLQQLSLPPVQFDGIFANACLFHVPSKSLPRVLADLFGTLKPGGILFVSNAHGFGKDQEGWTRGRTENTRSYVCWLSEDTWIKVCKEAGA
jgi:SAM-dependent methyltransferase